ncbi:hypothetical protein SESBI_33136 [Sesbania bispinosa]|nr:hypothetical protein SESBI_33136 [Sesbania bispinosa]
MGYVKRIRKQGNQHKSNQDVVKRPIQPSQQLPPAVPRRVGPLLASTTMPPFLSSSIHVTKPKPEKIYSQKTIDQVEEVEEEIKQKQKTRSSGKGEAAGEPIGLVGAPPSPSVSGSDYVRREVVPGCPLFRVVSVMWSFRGSVVLRAQPPAPPLQRTASACSTARQRRRRWRPPSSRPAAAAFLHSHPHLCLSQSLTLF